MSAERFILFFLTVMSFARNSHCVAVCGHNYTHNQELKAVFDETVDRLMAMRLRNWGWRSSQSIVLLQVAAPTKLIARERTKEKLKHDRFKKSKNQIMDLRKQALEAIAVKSLCMRPEGFAGVHLIQGIVNRLRNQFANKKKYPKVGYDRFSIAIGSLCVANHSISARFTEKLLQGQNYDGSFGNTDPIGDTIKLLPALQCLRSMKNPSFNLTKVDVSVRRARKYIISLVKTNDLGEVYIGYKNLTALALAGLWFSKDPEEKTSAWKCQEAIKTIGFRPSPQDNEIQLGTRLMLLSGKGFLDVGREDYKCVQPDPIPPGYRPTCNHRFPATCRPKF